MHFKCVACGIEFDNIQELASHKKQHQGSSSASASAATEPGMTCLGCGKRFPVEPAKANYSGPITCPHCHTTLKVVLKDGEVVVARYG
jgi:DNA-directed RNA polymerase subunit RPC12/RpoP